MADARCYDCLCLLGKFEECYWLGGDKYQCLRCREKMKRPTRDEGEKANG